MNENEEENEYDYNNDYEFMAFMGEEEADFYLPLNEHNPNVVIQVEDGTFYLWSKEALYMMSLTKVVVND